MDIHITDIIIRRQQTPMGHLTTIRTMMHTMMHTMTRTMMPITIHITIIIVSYS